MMIFALAGMVTGAILGINFSVLSLIPAMTCVLVIALATSILGNGVPLAWLLCLLVSLQVSYVVAASVRFALQRTAMRGSNAAPFVDRTPQGHSR
jgi:hypothetical protein